MKHLPHFRIVKQQKYRKIVFSLITSCIVIASFFFYTTPAGVDAQSNVSSQLQNLENQMYQLSQNIQNEESQLQNLSGKIQSNQNSVSQLQTIISQKQQLIDEKTQQINLLNQSISDEKNQINILTQQINQLYGQFIQRAQKSYENDYVNPFLIALGDKNIQDVFANLEYFASTRKEDADLLSQMNDTQYSLQQKLDDLNIQQTDLTNAQNQLVQEQNSVKEQQAQLQEQITNEQYSTNNIQHQLTSDQEKYQSIVSQLNSMQIGSFSGSGCVPGDWWYYNQQCYGRLAGMYGTSINMQAGCLITDIAMVTTKEIGYRFTPAQVAANTWFSGDYMMAWPSLPNGLGPVDLGYRNMSAINNELSRGIPVIVYLGAPDGQHWVVFDKQLGGGDYDIQDPWYGSHLRFLGSNGHEYYSTSEIGEAFILQ